jgi:hypothetical protein
MCLFGFNIDNISSDRVEMFIFINSDTEEGNMDGIFLTFIIFNMTVNVPPFYSRDELRVQELKMGVGRFNSINM